jgi:hypothetical protein
LNCRHVCKTCAFHDVLQSGKQKEVHPPYSPDLAPAGARSGEYGGLRHTTYNIIVLLVSTRHSKTLKAEHKQFCECCAGESSETQGDKKNYTVDLRRGILRGRRDTANELSIMYSSTEYVILRNKNTFRFQVIFR